MQRKNAAKYQDIVVSEEDMDIMKPGWYLNHMGYVQKSTLLSERMAGEKTTLMLHRVVMERTLGRPLKRFELVDHINGDKTDNRRENLRLVTHSQNMNNTKKATGKSSKYKGVAWEKSLKTWQIHVYQEKRLVKVGLSDDEVLAAKIYDVCKVFLNGDSARLNFPENIGMYHELISKVKDPIEHFRLYKGRIKVYV